MSTASAAATVQRKISETPAHERPPLDWASCLAAVPLFGGLSQRHLRRIARLAEPQRFGDGRTIVRAGDPGDAFFVILDGSAQVETPSGHTRLLQTDDSFGELALLDDAPRSATVVALGDVAVARIRRPAFLKLLREEPAIAWGLARSLVTTIRDLQAGDKEKVPDTGRLPATQSPPGESMEAPSHAVSNGAWVVGKRQQVAPSVLADVPLFRALPRRHLRKVARIAELRRYAGNTSVVLAGAHGAFLRVIVDGRARVVTPSGHERMLTRGDFFGELSLVDDAPRSASVVAVGGMTAIRIARPAFLRVVREEPAIAVDLVRGLVATVRDLQQADRSLG